MLFVCIMLLFLPLVSANTFYFHALSLFLSFFFISIMHSAFNLFVFRNSMFTSLLFICIFLSNFFNIFFMKGL